MKIPDSYASQRVVATGLASVSAAVAAPLKNPARLGQDNPPSTAVISSLSARLLASEETNAKSFGALSPDARKLFALSVINEVSYDLTPANIERADKQMPAASDSDAIESANQANAFMALPGSRNPFSSLAGDQLATIYGDRSGTFTINERRAAYTESARREQEWRVKIAAQAVQEYNDTGKLTNFFSEALTHFDGLSLLEQSLYPDDYASDLQAKIDLDFNYLTGQANPKSGSSNAKGMPSDAASAAIQHVLTGRSPDHR